MSANASLFRRVLLLLQFYKWFTDLELAMKSEVSDSHVVPRLNVADDYLANRFVRF